MVRLPTLIKAQALAVATGTAQLTTSLTRLRAFQLPLFPIDEQKLIVSWLVSRFESTNNTRVELSQAKTLHTHLEQPTLATVFRGRLISPDPNDEPARILLE